MIAGLDPSTRKLAFVGCNVRRAQSWHESITILKSGQKYTPELAAIIFETTYRVMVEHGVETLYIEAPLLARGGVRTAIILGYVGGAAHAGACYAGTEVVTTHVQDWKKTLGHGNLDKAGVCRSMEHLWPVMYAKVSGDQDAVDASAICWHGVERERAAVMA